MSVVNLKLLSNPLNWLTVAAWLLALGAAYIALNPSAGATRTTADTSSS